MDAKLHWEKIYQTKQPNEVSWYRRHLDVSVQLIEEATSRREAKIIDVGAGESTLVDDLLSRGYRNLCAMDISSVALHVARTRLGVNANKVHWLLGDVRRFAFGRHRYDVWHDRAVFHFMMDPGDRAEYVRQVTRAVKPGGHVIVATFGPDGPVKCSGLDVIRYDANALHAEFGTAFRLVKHRSELHQTPMGSTQQFTYCYCRVSKERE